jgi:predicted RNase H-like HicB family nuclease
VRSARITVELHPDGYVAYPLNFDGVVIGEGDTAEEAITDVLSAIEFHLETFGNDVSEA